MDVGVSVSVIFFALDFNITSTDLKNQFNKSKQYIIKQTFVVNDKQNIQRTRDRTCRVLTCVTECGLTKHKKLNSCARAHLTGRRTYLR